MGPFTIGVLTPRPTDSPLDPPEAFALGRAALGLASRGVRVVFGDEVRAGRISGLEAAPGQWCRVDGVPIVAAYDRFPSRKEPAHYQRLVEELGDVPLSNSPAAVRLCRDKLALQRALERRGIRMPPVVAEPASFERVLAEWGAAFVKPRFGYCGHGVRRVVPGERLPPVVEGGIAGELEPVLLQQAVEPPPGWAGMAVRILAQKVPGEVWALAPAVMRMSRTDPVVNAHRGATVAAAQDVVAGHTLAACRSLAEHACVAIGDALGDEPVIELGVDLVVDRDQRPHLIEVNGRPQGRLGVLAALEPTRFGEDHRRVCERPLQYIASRYALTRRPGVVGFVGNPDISRTG